MAVPNLRQYRSGTIYSDTTITARDLQRVRKAIDGAAARAQISHSLANICGEHSKFLRSSFASVSARQPGGIGCLLEYDFIGAAVILKERLVDRRGVRIDSSARAGTSSETKQSENQRGNPSHQVVSARGTFVSGNALLT
jgi:hypothetical protein